MTEKPAIKFRTRRSFPVLYMFAVTFVATGILIGLSRSTAGRVEANKQILFERAVLSALGVDAGPRPSPANIHQTFLAQVKPPTESTAGAYRLVRDGATAAYALPFAGRGFWNEIRGVMGISPDGSVLTGVAFYEQSETPGLGAEIVKPAFTEQFRNLKLAGGSSALGLKPAGTKTSASEVDAITGATQTCTRLEDILNDALGAWRREMGLHESGGAAAPDGSGEDG